MKLPPLKNIKWNYLALAFAIPCAGLLFLMLLGGYEPFGNSRSMLYSDMYHQYYPFFLDFRESILSGRGLLYNWTIGMGLDYLGLISYYLASPLNLLTVLVPKSLMLEYFSILMPVKLGLASMFFAIFLKDIFRKDDLSITLFGGFYGLCAWALGYQWNIMWLDTFALLPLVALGTIRLLRDKRFFLYTVTLFLSVAANYYIGFFTCIFVLLVFICYEVCRFRGFKRLFTDLCRIALFSILAIGMTAFLELPALMALQTTQSGVNNFPKGFRLNIASEHNWKGLLDAMRQVAGNMGGGLEPSFKEGLPNLYCGVGTVILSFLYLTCKRIKLRDKICCVLLLLFFSVSFIIRQLDYIWHGFHFTNMIPYRFSFLYSFVMLYMAYKAWLQRKRFKQWQLITAAVLALLVFFCSDSRTDPVFIAYNLIFLVLYTGALLFPSLQRALPADADKSTIHAHIQERNQRRKISAWLMAGVMVGELLMNGINFGTSFPYTSISNYPSRGQDTAAVLEQMREWDDELFYRTEVTHSQTLNDSAINGYFGISTFTSSANVRVTEFMEALGYGAKNTYNRYCFEEASPIANLFLGLKYMVERDGNVEVNPYFDIVDVSGTVALLKNNAYLPLGFLAEAQLVNTDFKMRADNFTMQNKLLTAASGVSGNFWRKIGRNGLSITSTDVELLTASSSGYSSYKAESAGTVEYSYTADRSGLLCIDLSLPKHNSYSVGLNGTTLYRETYSLPQMLSATYVEPGDVVQLRLDCKAGEEGTMTISAAILDDELFRQAYDVLNASTLKLTEFTSTRLEGTISCNRDGLLYTSIPQNGNWTATVDGEPVDIILVGEAMISVPLTEGDHTVVFQYHNKAFSLGWKISLGCAAVFAVIAICCYLPGRKKGKYEKSTK